MEEEDDLLPLEDGTQQTLADGGLIPVLSDVEDPEQGLLPVESLSELVQRAQTAVQPQDLASGAGLDVGDVMLVSEHRAIVTEILARLQAVEEIAGLNFGSVFEDDVFDEEVFV